LVDKSILLHDLEEERTAEQRKRDAEQEKLKQAAEARMIAEHQKALAAAAAQDAGANNGVECPGAGANNSAGAAAGESKTKTNSPTKSTGNSTPGKNNSTLRTMSSPGNHPKNSAENSGENNDGNSAKNSGERETVANPGNNNSGSDSALKSALQDANAINPDEFPNLNTRKSSDHTQATDKSENKTASAVTEERAEEPCVKNTNKPVSDTNNTNDANKLANAETAGDKAGDANTQNINVFHKLSRVIVGGAKNVPSTVRNGTQRVFKTLWKGSLALKRRLPRPRQRLRRWWQRRKLHWMNSARRSCGPEVGIKLINHH
jgi:hypothetical protein